MRLQKGDSIITSSTSRAVVTFAAGYEVTLDTDADGYTAFWKSFGPVLDPHAVWLLERGIKTLAVRMARHNENGLAVAAWLEQHPAVQRVFYPGLPSHPDHERALEALHRRTGVNAGDRTRNNI